MKTLDTISDFIRYLTKKEKLISSEKLIAAAGEDDLLAFYLMQIDDAGEHTFFPNSKTQPDGIVIDQGFWDTFQKHPSRIAQIRANRISYSWNMLIEKFIFHITTGTSYKMSHPSLKTQEGLFRLLAKEDRTRRRMLAESLHDLLARTPKDYRATRLLLPSHVGEPHYLFLLLPKPENESYEEYRRIRGELLSCYLRITKVKRPEVKDIIGFATEPGTSKNRSEDIMYFDASNWTDQDEKETRRIEKEFVQCGLFGKRSMFMDTFKEYPDRQTRPIKISMKGDERNKPCPCGSGKKFKKCCGA
jgi:hypothetical protein